MSQNEGDARESQKETPSGTFLRPARRPVLDPNQTVVPDPSLVDFSFLLEPPAGKHGFLKAGKDGNLYFEDGTLARFTGADFVGRQAMRDVRTSPRSAFTRSRPNTISTTRRPDCGPAPSRPILPDGA